MLSVPFINNIPILISLAQDSYKPFYETVMGHFY